VKARTEEKMSRKTNKRDRISQREIAIFADFLEPVLEEAADELAGNIDDIQDWIMMALMIKKLNPAMTAKELLPSSLADVGKLEAPLCSQSESYI